MFKIKKNLPTLPKLNKGDTVCVVAPGMASDPKNLPKIKQFLEGNGFKAHIPRGIFAKGYISSNSLKKRMEFLAESILAEESKMIWCIRGGYGAHELLPFLNKFEKPKPKLFCGFSDATSLHTFFIQNWGWSTLHGSHLDKIAMGQVDKKQVSDLFKIIRGEKPLVTFNQLKPLNAKAEKLDDLHARLMGGNLITLQSHVGTPWELKGRGDILFFEDIGERAYRIKRVLTHFEQIGLFDRAKAIVFGDFTNCTEPDGKNLIPKLLKDFAEAQKIPVFHKLPCGHGKTNWTLPLGAQAQLYKLKNKFIFNIDTGVGDV